MLSIGCVRLQRSMIHSKQIQWWCSPTFSPTQFSFWVCFWPFWATTMLFRRLLTTQQECSYLAQSRSQSAKAFLFTSLTKSALWWRANCKIKRFQTMILTLALLRVTILRLGIQTFLTVWSPPKPKADQFSRWTTEVQFNLYIMTCEISLINHCDTIKCFMWYSSSAEDTPTFKLSTMLYGYLPSLFMSRAGGITTLKSASLAIVLDTPSPSLPSTRMMLSFGLSFN